MTTSTSTHQKSIDRFLLGQMTPDEELGFRKQMAADPSLQREVGIMRRIIKAISVRASRMERMADWDNTDEVTGSITTTTRNLTLRVAATVVILLSIGAFMLIRTSDVRDGSSHIPANVTSSATESGAAVFRGASDPTVNEICRELEGVESLSRHTLVMIDAALADTMGERNLRPEEAEYQTMLRSYQEYDLRWMRIKALLATGDVAKALDELRVYAQEEGYNQTEAKTLLKQFE